MDSLKKVTPHRFVYHLTKKSNRASIAHFGLLACDGSWYENAVFSHNSNSINSDWYPYVFEDVFYYTCITGGSGKYYSQIINDDQPIVTNMLYFLEYDIWRIDTHKLNRDWFIDSVTAAEFLLNPTIPFYIMSHSDIPVSALKLINLENPIDIFLQKIRWYCAHHQPL
jgi:hypothetical protein